MRPGEELKDGPPIHGNTRLEIIWTAIPAIILVGALHLRLRRPDRHRGGRGQRDAASASSASSSPGPSTTASRAARRSPRRSSTCPSGQPVKFTVQSKDVIHDFWVPAFRMKIDAVPGHQHAPTASRPTKHRRLPGRLRRAVRPRALGDAPDRARRARRAEFDAWLADARQARPAAAGGAGGRRRRRRGADGKTLFTEPPPAAAPATRSPTRARPARPARTSTRSSRARTRPSSSSRSTTRTPRSRRASGRASCRRTTARRLQPAELDALVKYLAKVTQVRRSADDRRAARTRAGTAAALFIVLGVAVRARARDAIRAGLRLPTRSTARRLGRRRQDAVLIVVAARARRCSSSSASARSTTGSTGPPGKPTRPEDHSGHGAH